MIDTSYYPYSATHIGWKNIRSIVQNNPHLLELELAFYVIWKSYDDDEISLNINHLSGLTSLKVLKIYLGTVSAAPLANYLSASTAPIEHMELKRGIIDKSIIDAISNMKHLKKLQLDEIGGLTDEHMIELAVGSGSRLESLKLCDRNFCNLKDFTTIGLKKMLPFFTKLSLLTLDESTIRIDADDYQTMLNVVRQRPGNGSLLIELTGGKGGRIEVDKAVLLANRDCF